MVLIPRLKTQKNNIKYFGAGLNKKRSSKPVIIDTDNKKIGFFGFQWGFTGVTYSSENNYGASPLYIKYIQKVLSEYKQLDYKVIYLHFGTEFEDYPEPYQKYIVDKLIDLDLVDIIIGNHPHCIQGYKEENIEGKKKLVFYSLGNFILPEVNYGDKKLEFPQKSKFGFFVNIDFEKNLDYAIIPYKLVNDSTKAIDLTIKERKLFFNKINKISTPLKLGYQEYKSFYKKNRNRKFRPLMTKNKKINFLKKKIYKFIEYIIVNSSKRIGLYKLLRYIYRKLERLKQLFKKKG